MKDTGRKNEQTLVLQQQLSEVWEILFRLHFLFDRIIDYGNRYCCPGASCSINIQ